MEEMKRYILLCLLLFGIFLVSLLKVEAQTATDSPSLSPTATGTLKEQRAETRNQFRDDRTEAREQYKEEMQQAREQFRQKLTSIRDQRKRQVIERIDTNMGNVNQRATTHMENVLEKLSRILSSVKEKAATAGQAGIDTTSLTTAILNAENSLASASAAVAAQKEKEYVIPLQSDATAKINVGETLKQLHEDLRKTYQSVLAAKTAVQTAVKELRKVIIGQEPINP